MTRCGSKTWSRHRSLRHRPLGTWLSAAASALRGHDRHPGHTQRWVLPGCFCTMRTARSRTSGENLFDLFRAPSSKNSRVGVFSKSRSVHANQALHIHAAFARVVFFERIALQKGSSCVASGFQSMCSGISAPSKLRHSRSHALVIGSTS